MADQPVVIYHNARCSKSRAACQLIAEAQRNAVHRGGDRPCITADCEDCGRSIGLHLRAIGDHPARGSLPAHPPQFAGRKPLERAAAPDPHRAGQRMAACLAALACREIARRTGACRCLHASATPRRVLLDQPLHAYLASFTSHAGISAARPL